MTRVRGNVININGFGATVRLSGGEMAAVPMPALNADRPAYARALQSRQEVLFDVLGQEGGRTIVALSPEAPEITSERLEAQITKYLKETEEWELSDAAPAHERHFLRKKRRAAFFESRHATDR
ncbi:MAG: S1 domain-containing protein [Candidatus Eremiobacteraeota bacterium]|nr:S1 domain-containing protein [Candidatus Eremiobacteraeota bacterium]